MSSSNSITNIQISLLCMSSVWLLSALFILIVVQIRGHPTLFENKLDDMHSFSVLRDKEEDK